MSLFVLVNKEGQTIMIKANCPELALIKAGRLGDVGWSIVCELSEITYCHSTLKAQLSKGYDELTDELYCYFQSLIDDRRFDAYIHTDCIENILNIREHEDIVNYVIDNY